MRSKKRTIGILIVLMVILLGFAGSLLVYRNKSSSENSINDSDIYTVVDKEIYETIVTDTFRNSNLEKRKEIALNLLKKLESNNMIKKGSITFDEKSNQFFYEYIGGGDGTILLEDFSDTEIGVSSNNREYSEFDNTIFETITEEGYTVATNLTSVIIESLGKGKGYDDAKLFLDKEAEAWTKNNMTTDVKHDLTAEEMKTALLSYDFSVIYLHGVYDKNHNTAMKMEHCNFGDNLLYPFSKYHDDIKNGRIFIGTYSGGTHYFLTSDFFSYYYKNKLKEKIIWLNTCHGYENDVLVKSFSDCGAKTVIGATETVDWRYTVRMVDAFVNRLLFGYSVKDALLFAKSQWEENDAIYLKKYHNEEDNTPAEFRCYGNGDMEYLQYLTLKSMGAVSGVVVDETGNPIENANIIINQTLSNTFADKKVTTDSTGYFKIDCPVGNYKIQVSADGYEDYAYNEVINVEKDFEAIIGTIQLKKSVANWNSAYIEVLSNLNNSSARFMTAYIDEDDIPELIVSYSSAHVAGCEIYTYYDGKVSKLEGNPTNGEFGSSGGILYSPYKNLFNSRYYGTGSNSDGLFRINNGNAEVECALQHNDYFATVRVIEFKIDGIEVTENEFLDKYNSYEIDSMVSANYDDMIEVNSTNISNYFNNINDTEFSGSGVIDEKKIFTKNQLDEINDNIRETAKNLNMNIMIYLGDSSGWSEEQTKRFADSTYDDIFGIDSDGVFYYMDLSEDSDAYDYISTSGIANKYYNGKIEDMFEEIFKYLPATGEPIVDTQIQSAICQILLVFDEYHDSIS